jgi:ABC-type bacteriocin/lantibiotic exporter with double-glycine peptidase domain
MLAVLPPINVPFVAQRANGCAAAAVTMVLRYWGDPAPEAEMGDAMPGPSSKDVAGSRLADLARRRGHDAVAYRGDIAHLRDFTAKGRPLIVAVKSGRRGYHDVVVIGFDERDHTVVVHDPEAGPSQRVPARAFEQRWAGAGYWTLLVLPAQP